MKRGVKQKYCEYFLFLNLFGGIGFFALYPYKSQQVKLKTTGLSYEESVENTLAVKSALEPKNTIVFGNSTDKPIVRVLVWTNYFQEHPLSALHVGEYGFSQMTDCSVRCQFTSDREKLSSADAVVFHSRDIRSDDFPTNRPHNQVWVFMNQESPANTIEDLKDLPNVFNWTMTYKSDSDVYHPYGEAIPINGNLRNITPFLENSGPISTYLHPLPNYEVNALDLDLTQKDNSKLVAWVVSNCYTQSQREKLVNQLKQYLPIDVFGSCGDHHCQKDDEEGCFPEIEKEYKFYLSFENSLCDEYITEKFFRILNYSIVPIVYGGANYSDLAPPGSYINARDFNTSEDLARYLLYLDKHPVEYFKYFKWKKYYKVIPGKGWCSLCSKLSQRDITTRKWYTNLWRWWHFKADEQITNYQISHSKVPGDQNSRHWNVSNYASRSTVPHYLSSVVDSNDSDNLSPMCVKPLDYPEQTDFGLVSKILRAFRNIFY